MVLVFGIVFLYVLIVVASSTAPVAFVLALQLLAMAIGGWVGHRHL